MKNAYNTSAYGSFAYVYDIFMDKGAAFPKWAVIIILIVGFLAGALTFPITDTSSNKTASIERVNF